MRAVALTLLKRVDELTAAMVAGYRERIPEYMELLESNKEDVEGVSRAAAKTFLELIVEDRQPTAAELTVIRNAGRARASQGMALEAMLQAYSIGREIAWRFIHEEAERRQVDEDQVAQVSLRLTQFMDRLTLMVTQGFLDHVRQAYDEERQRLTALVDLAKAVNHSLDLDEVANIGLDLTRSALNMEWAGLWLVDPPRLALRLYREHFADDWPGGLGLRDENRVQALETSPVGRAARAGQSLLLTGKDLAPEAASAGARVMLMVPLMLREQPLGMLAVASRTRASLSGRDQELAIAIADQLAVAIHQVQEHMREARTDFLTGLANRTEFDSFLRREMARSERFGDPLALAMMDLDGLKRINDRDGHHAGDEVLRLVGRTLRETVRTLDLACRIGGDEFALVMPDTQTGGAADVLKRFAGRIELLRLAGWPDLGVSAGYATWKKGLGFDEFCAAADAALYEEKRRRAGPGRSPAPAR